MKVEIIATNPRNREWDNEFRGRTRQRLLKIDLNTIAGGDSIEIPETAIYQWADFNTAIFTYTVNPPKSLAVIDKIFKDELSTITEGLNDAIETIVNTRLTKEEYNFYFTYRKFEVNENSLVIKDKNK